MVVKKKEEQWVTSSSVTFKEKFQVSIPYLRQPNQIKIKGKTKWKYAYFIAICWYLHFFQIKEENNWSWMLKIFCYK